MAELQRHLLSKQSHGRSLAMAGAGGDVSPVWAGNQTGTSTSQPSGARSGLSPALEALCAACLENQVRA